MKSSIAALVLLTACAHEFGWLFWPDGLQGYVRQVTQWPLIVALCVSLSVLARSAVVSAVCAAVVVMSSTTALCSVAWLAAPWVLSPGEESCSRHWGVPLLMISAVAAGLAAEAVSRFGGRHGAGKE